MDINETKDPEIFKSNDDEDAWDNDLQKCWVGYRQAGMKEKGGRMVPNCVPVKKSDESEQTTSKSHSMWKNSAFSFYK